MGFGYKAEKVLNKEIDRNKNDQYNQYISMKVNVFYEQTKNSGPIIIGGGQEPCPQPCFNASILMYSFSLGVVRIMTISDVRKYEISPLLARANYFH